MMKRNLSTLIIALLCFVATSQASNAFTEEFRADYAFLSDGQIGDDDCYTFKLGAVMHNGEEAQEIAMKDLIEVLSATPVILAKDGCPAAETVTPFGMIISYADPKFNDVVFSAERMQEIQETQGYAEKLLYNAAAVTFNDISFLDTDGNSHRLSDKVFTIKN